MGRLLVVLAGVVLPVALAFAAAGHLPGTTWPVIAIGASAFIFMAVNLLLAARLPRLDGLFQGLDQVYFVLTDDVGNANDNLDMSFRRADSLARFLLSEGMKGSISAGGLGEIEPPAYCNATADSIAELRTIARRVEVAFA